MRQTTPSPSLHTPPRALLRRTQMLILLILALAVGMGLGLGPRSASPLGGGSGQHAAPAGQPGASPGFHPTAAQLNSLELMSVGTMTFRTERVTDGKIALDADKTTPVFSPFSGRVTKIFANLGDHVRQGAPLLAVEATELVQGQNDLLSAAAGRSTASSQLRLAQTNEKRKRALYEAKGGSLQDWQQSQADLVTAENNLRSAKTALAMVRNRLRILGKSEAEIDALERAQTMDPVALVRAPISGTVTERAVGPGQYLQSGSSTPVYTIGDLSTVWLVANVREADAPLMHRDEPAEVRVLALPDRVFRARLTYVGPAVDPNTHRLPVRAEVENPDRALKPEMFASFSIITGGESAAPAVPERAVIYEGDSARVWVALQGGAIASRQIRVGRTMDGIVEVLAGLTPGERVVTSGTLFIDRAANGD